MKKHLIRALVSCMVVTALSGCAVAKKELHHAGGYAGYKMDEYVFDASGSPEQQLLRYTFLAAVSASIAEATLTDEDDKDIFIRRMTTVVDQINFQAGELYGNGVLGSHCASNEAESNNCQSRPVMFQKNLPKLDYALGRMIIAGLPQRQAAEVAGSMSSASVLAVGWKMIKLGARAADGGRRGAATYRASLETIMLAMPECAGKTAQDCLGTSEATWLKMPKAKTIRPERAIGALPTFLDMMRQSCATVLSIDENADSAGDERKVCQKITFTPKLRFGGLRL